VRTRRAFVKKLWFTSVAVIILLAIAVTPVAAQDKPRNITFLQVRNFYGKGLVFRFSYTGKFKNYELQNAFVYWNGHEYTLDCNFGNEIVISCVAQAGLRNQVGQRVTGTIAGFEFTTIIPIPRGLTTQYCYSVWDYWDFTDWQWADMTTYWNEPLCQDNPANVGDLLYYEMVYGVYIYGDLTVFSTDGTDVCAPNNGAGYYYNNCN
jgi:hypothetical protein